MPKQSGQNYFKIEAVQIGCFLRPLRWLAPGFLAAALLGQPAWAQQAFSESADPGEIERRIEERDRPPPSDAPELRLLPSPAPAPLPEEAPTALLSAVAIEGASVFTPEDFGPLYEEFLVTEVGAAEIEEILERITQLYQDAGYFLSRAIAPPQDLAAGVLQVRIIEGYVGRVAFEGEALDESLLSAYAERVTSARPLTRSLLERSILLVNDLPGVSLGAGIRPIDEEAGIYELVLAVEETSVDATAFLDNRGTPAVGRLQTWLSSGLNSLFGMGERIEVGFFTVPNQPQELIYFRVGYDQPIGTNGTYLGLSGSFRERVTAARPLTRSLLERSILLVNDLPGVSLGAGIRPIDEEAGIYELVLAVEETSVDATAFLDNRGTPAVGRLQTWLSSGLNSLFGMGERIEVGFFTVPNQPQELIYFRVGYDQPIGTNGTYLGLSGSFSEVDAGANLARSDTESDSQSFTVQVRHPVVRTRDLTLWLAASFDYRNLEQERFGTRVINDQLRVVRGRADLSFADDLGGSTFFQLEASQGLDILGASGAGSFPLSRVNGEAEFTKVYGTLVRQQALGENFGIQVALAGQKSADTLLSSEEFGLGGTRFGRAYDPSEITGEDGLAASVELRFGMGLDNDWLQAFQVYGFYDIGAVWNDLPGGGRTRDSLASAGGGVRLTVTPYLQANVEVGLPLTRSVATTGSNAPRVFFSISANF